MRPAVRQPQIVIRAATGAVAPVEGAVQRRRGIRCTRCISGGATASIGTSAFSGSLPAHDAPDDPAHLAQEDLGENLARLLDRRAH